MINKSLKESSAEHGHWCGLFCMSWSAVFFGALVGIGLSFLLNLFGVAIGLAAFKMDAGIKTIVMGGFIGMVISVMVSTFLSGWVAGFLGRDTNTHPCVGVLYGFITWCVALIVGILLSANIGQFVQTQYATFSDRNAAVIKLTSLSSMAEESAREGHSSLNAAIHPTDEKEMHALGKTLLLTFILFLVGAITSSFGGYVGIRKDHPLFRCPTTTKKRY